MTMLRRVLRILLAIVCFLMADIEFLKFNTTRSFEQYMIIKAFESPIDDSFDVTMGDLTSKKKVIYVFYKPDCPYCKAGLPYLSKTLIGSLKTVYVNLDTKAGQEIKIRFGVKYASTVVVVEGDKETSFLYSKKDGNKFVPDKQAIKKGLGKLYDYKTTQN